MSEMINETVNKNNNQNEILLKNASLEQLRAQTKIVEQAIRKEKVERLLPENLNAVFLDDNDVLSMLENHKKWEVDLILSKLLTYIGSAAKDAEAEINERQARIDKRKASRKAKTETKTAEQISAEAEQAFPDDGPKVDSYSHKPY